ncbi:MAG: VOC family protein [Pseudomonadota bacterium]
MSIEPTIKCSDISASIEFYTQILDFGVLVAPDPDPSAFMSKYACLEREGDCVHLSSHAGDGCFGGLFYVRVDDIDKLYAGFTENGLDINMPCSGAGLRIAPVDQTWGMREFSVVDPDGNKLTFGHELS